MVSKYNESVHSTSKTLTTVFPSPRVKILFILQDPARTVSLGNRPRSSLENSPSLTAPVSGVYASALIGVQIVFRLLLMCLYNETMRPGGQRTYVLLSGLPAAPRSGPHVAEGGCHLRTKCG